MVTTNLSMRRPHALPTIGGNFIFKVEVWARLFPRAVIAYLQGNSRDTGKAVAPESPLYAGYRSAPDANDLPVIVAVRMSLGFPGLIEVVPMKTTDLAPVTPFPEMAHRTRRATGLRGCKERWWTCPRARSFRARLGGTAAVTARHRGLTNDRTDQGPTGSAKRRGGE
jgi:hypothetical protein